MGTSVDLYCSDYIMKPKRDIWDLDKLDGTLTIICMPNLLFDIPYDTSSWGSCLAKCPEPSKITTTSELEVAYDQMTGGAEDELWEGEQLVYRCRNDTLVLNDNPDLIKIKYKCRNTGMYLSKQNLDSYKDQIYDVSSYFQANTRYLRRSLTGLCAPRSL